MADNIIIKIPKDLIGNVVLLFVFFFIGFIGSRIEYHILKHNYEDKCERQAPAHPFSQPRCIVSFERYLNMAGRSDEAEPILEEQCKIQKFKAKVEEGSNSYSKCTYNPDHPNCPCAKLKMEEI